MRVQTMKMKMGRLRRIIPLMCKARISTSNSASKWTT